MSEVLKCSQCGCLQHDTLCRITALNGMSYCPGCLQQEVERIYKDNPIPPTIQLPHPVAFIHLPNTVELKSDDPE